MATQGGAPKKNFFDGNALSGSIHSTYQLPSLQTNQIPTLGQPNLHNVMFREGFTTVYPDESRILTSQAFTEGFVFQLEEETTSTIYIYLI